MQANQTLPHASGWVLQSNRKPLLSRAEVKATWPLEVRADGVGWWDFLALSSPLGTSSTGRSIHIYTSFIILEVVMQVLIELVQSSDWMELEGLGNTRSRASLTL